jgi:hypothetical protein
LGRHRNAKRGIGGMRRVLGSVDKTLPDRKNPVASNLWGIFR